MKDHNVCQLYKATQWSPSRLSPKLADINRYLGLVLLELVPSIARRRAIVDGLVDDCYHSESVSAPELFPPPTAQLAGCHDRPI